MADDQQEVAPTDDAPPKGEEELLDEWMNMADGEGGEDQVEERILDQSEIDSLLGIDDDGGSKESGGVRVLLDSSIISYERLPLLEVVFDRFERIISTSLRQFTADNVDISIENMTSVRYGEYMDTIPLPAGLVVVNARGLDDYILLAYESRLIYAIVDILLGGRRSRPARIEGRNFTTIERKIIEQLSEVVLDGLDEAFEPVAPINFEFERIESNPRFATVTREGNACILVTIRLNLEERDGIMQFCLPYATLEPIRDQLLQQFMGEKFGHDNIWENHLAQELFSTKTKMSCVMGEQTYMLSDALGWRIGDTLVFNAKEGDPVHIKFGNITKMVGSMGRDGSNLAVKVIKTIADVNDLKSEGQEL